MGRFENSTRDFQCIDESDETPSSIEKRRIDRNKDNPDKEPLPTKRRKGGSSVSETSKKCNEFEKSTATNKSKVAHSKNGVKIFVFQIIYFLFCEVVPDFNTCQNSI